MDSELPTMTLKAIGIVRNDVKERQPDGYEWWVDVVSEIEIDPTLTEALDGLEKYPDITVLYWMHRIVEGNVPMKVHPRGRKESPPRGTFATRSPNRPNRIGKTTVKLLGREGNILWVKGLDALDGTPVIDIKPYVPDYDSPGNIVKKP